MEADLDVGVSGVEGADELWHGRVDGGAYEAEAHNPCPAVASATGCLDGAIDVDEEQPRVPKERLARGGHSDPATGSDEERSADALLELRDLLAEGWLGDVQMLSRAPESAMVNDRDQVPQMAQLDTVVAWTYHEPVREVLDRP